MLSRKILIGGLGLILASGGGYYFYAKSSNSKTQVWSPRIISVSTGSISETVKATGNISAFEESTLSFGREGIVAAIYKKEWEGVKAWELIAEISAGTAELDMESANRNLADAQSAYNELFATPKAGDLAKSKATLEESKASLDLMEKQYESLLRDQKDTLAETEENLALLKKKAELAESEYSYTKKNLEPNTKVDELQKDIESAWGLIEDTSRTFRSQVRQIENITGIRDKVWDYYYDISSSDQDLKSKTDYTYSTLLDKLSLYETWIVVIQKNNTQTDFDTVYNELTATKEMLNNVDSFINLVLQELDATPTGSPWSPDFIQSTRDTIWSLSNTLTTKKNSINSTLITLKNYGSDDLQDLADKNTLANKEQSLISAKNTVTKAERDLESLKKDQEISRISSQNNISKQKNTIEQNSYAYQDLTDGPDASERRSAESKLASAKISVKKAQEWMKDYQITASFDGTIEDIPWTVWETAETTKWILIANKNTYKIELSLDQIDVVKIKEWMPAIVTLDAYAGKEFTGSVISISATPTITSGVVSYTATIWVSITWIKVMSSMSASVSIIVSSAADSILIPSGAVTSKNGKSYVTITNWEPWSPWITEEREVTVWKTTNGKIEVLSGLTVGEKILYTPVRQQSTSSGSNTSTSRSTNQVMRSSMWGTTGWPPPGF